MPLPQIEEVKLMLRTIFAGLNGSFNFEKSLIERVVCEDEVDQEILRLLFETGSPGLLPKDLANKLERFGIKRHQVSGRILRMNKRLEKEFGKHVAEKRGWHWASPVSPTMSMVNLKATYRGLIHKSLISEKKSYIVYYIGYFTN